MIQLESVMQSNLGGSYQTKGDDPKAIIIYILKNWEQFKNSSRKWHSLFKYWNRIFEPKKYVYRGFEAYLHLEANF